MQNHEVYNSSITSDLLLNWKMRRINEIYNKMDRKMQTNFRSFFSHSFTHWDLLLNLIFILHFDGIRIEWVASSFGIEFILFWLKCFHKITFVLASVFWIHPNLSFISTHCFIFACLVSQTKQKKKGLGNRKQRPYTVQCTFNAHFRHSIF